jgi:hypothetical protein
VASLGGWLMQRRALTHSGAKRIQGGRGQSYAEAG